MRTRWFTEIDSPVGMLRLVADATGLRRIDFLDGVDPVGASDGLSEDSGRLREAARQLGAYFAGDLRDFSLELAPEGTAFQLEVWRRLRAIPYGETTSYGEVAARIGNPRASRAVGLANGANPLPIVIPCHRVIGKGGALVGYGGGLPIKMKLLAIERGGMSGQAPATRPRAARGDDT